MIRVLIAANSVVVRAGLEALVSANSQLEVVGTIANPTAEQIADLQPDVLLLELEMLEAEILSAVLDEAFQPPALVVLVDELQEASVSEILLANVRGVLPSDAIASDITAAIIAAAAGLIVLHPDIVDLLLPSLPLANRPAIAPGSPSDRTLTVREVEVLGMLAEGVGNKTIARRLNISEHTVKFHVGSILSKLSASSRTEAVMLGARQGLILL